MVSENGTVTVLIARLKEDTDKFTVAQQLKQIVLQTSGDEKIYFGGIPFQMVSLTEMIQKDIIFLIPLVVLLLAITLALTFQTFRGVLLPLITVFISTAWALGIMALFGIDLTIASNGMPVLLLAIGSAYAIHVVTKYKEDILLGENKFQAIKDALSEVGVPIFLAGITTMIGFLAFLTSNLTLIKQFGILAAIGVFVAFFVSITFLPALLSFMHPPKIKKDRNGQQNTIITSMLFKLCNFVFKRKKMIIVIGMIIFVAGLFALPHIHREVNMVDYFKKSSEIRQAEDMMEAKLGGSVPIQILVRGDLKQPNIEYLVMTGATRDRQTLVDQFQNDDTKKVFLMTLKTGGLGLNLTAADYIFIYDPWWNITAENQAIDRTHRIGQDKTVFSYKIITRKTIEEKILKLQELKKELFESLISSDGASIKSLNEKDVDFVLG